MWVAYSDKKTSGKEQWWRIMGRLLWSFQSIRLSSAGPKESFPGYFCDALLVYGCRGQGTSMENVVWWFIHRLYSCTFLFVLNDAFRAALILRIKYRENRIQKINLAISNGRKLWIRTKEIVSHQSFEIHKCYSFVNIKSFKLLSFWLFLLILTNTNMDDVSFSF